MKFKKGDIVIPKDEAYNDPDTIIVTRTYYANECEKFDGYSKCDGRPYIALFADCYKLVESGEDKPRDIDRLWSALRKIHHELPYVDYDRLFHHTSFGELLEKYDPEEIISIIQKYDDAHSKLTPGDEILLISEDEFVVVISIDTEHENMNVLNKDGVVRVFYFEDTCWKKSGAHYFIDTLVSAIQSKNESYKNKKGE